MAITLDGKSPISAGATDIVSWDWTSNLSGDELVASATVTEITTADLTITNLAGTPNTGTVSDVTLEINDREVAVGKAVRFRVSGQKPGCEYRVRMTITTDSSPTRIIPIDRLFRCE